MSGPLAITREVSPSLADCELTHLEREPVDVARAAAEHEGYCAALRDLGLEVVCLPALPEHPDAVFVEDVAVVLPPFAVLTRPGVASRRGEVAAMAETLGRHRPLLRLEDADPAATLDGGDVLRVGRTLFVGQGGRSNAAAVQALGRLVGDHGFDVVPVPVHGCLHLKSAVSHLGDGTLLAHRPWVDTEPFGDRPIRDVPADEPEGANVLAVAGRVLVSTAHAATAELLSAAGYSVLPVDNRELLKAESGLTCCSLILEPAASA